MTNQISAEMLRQARAAMAALARHSVRDFTAYTNPKYTFGWFNELLCKELDQFMLDVEQGKMPMLMIFAPPRSGKSELASRRFPAYVMGKHPDWHFIGASYAADLAKRMSKDVRRIIGSPQFADTFPDLCLPPVGVGAADQAVMWETVNREMKLTGGSYRAAGVNGGITGGGMNIGIIDDPAKDYQQASSKAYQESVIDWFDTTFYTRVDPRLHGIIIILTRWHKNDLAGQLLKQAQEGGQQWKVVSFPMEAEADEFYEVGGRRYHTRKPGDLLFPERMPPDFVASAKRRGSLVWNALYQQRPTQKGGSLIKTENFNRYKQLPPIKKRWIYADTAQKTEERHDYSVLECWGECAEGRPWLIDLVRGKWEAPELERRFIAFWDKHKAADRGKFGSLIKAKVEDKASGTQLIQHIRKKGRIPVEGIQRSKDKYTRFMDIQGYIESGYVNIPEEAPWLSDFLMECEEVTADFNTHDDQIDPMMDAINDILNTKRRGTFG